MRSSVRPIDKDTAQPPTIVPANAKVTEILYAGDLVEWTGDEWKVSDMLSVGGNKRVGDKVSLFVPIGLNGQVLEYTVKFRLFVPDDALARVKLLDDLKVGMPRVDAEFLLMGNNVEKRGEIINGAHVETWWIPAMWLSLRFDSSGLLWSVEKRAHSPFGW